MSGLLAPRHRRRPARLSSQSTAEGAEYRRRPELKPVAAIPVKEIRVQVKRAMFSIGRTTRMVARDDALSPLLEELSERENIG